MAKINLLNSKIYNRIAAGEVVERPASVVKELVENSLDAKATSITVEIEEGGISLIKITDNGSGIEKSELKKALLPHATSKIATLKDLDNIASLGFRGEALASIASVSKITIKSKPTTQESGGEIYAESNEIGKICDCAIPNGTEISVQNLFFNTPVRAKFLKTPRSEEGEITATISRFIIGHPNVAFKYVADGKTILQSYGDGFESAFACVYGAKTVGDCFYIQTEKNGITINGYLGKHYFTKPNRSYQTVFLNGRYIVNQTVASAIGNAYAAYLMKRQYPFYVLNISVPTDVVDVNVHPNKIDVRFANNQIIYGSIYSVVSKVLDGSGEALNIVSDFPLNNVEKIETEKSADVFKQNSIHYDTHNSLNTQYKPLGNISFSDIGAPTGTKSASFDFSKKKDEKTEPVVDIFAENKAYIEKLEREKAEKLKVATEQLAAMPERELTLIGQALNTYLIFQDGLDLYFIDQHAAHERVLFDELNEKLKNQNVETQPLLIPYVLNVNPMESEFLAKKCELLNKMGIEMEEFGRNTFKISALPVFLAQMNVKKFFDDVLTDVNELKNLTVNDLLMEKLAQKACKSAIKSGDTMSDSQIKSLMNMLKGNLGLKCPHGRPIAVKITRTEIDKWFKRII